MTAKQIEILHACETERKKKNVMELNNNIINSNNLVHPGDLMNTCMEVNMDI